MQGALDILRPLLAETGAKPIGMFVMGTVKGDVHDIGKNLVNIMLEAGFTVHDLGVNVPPERFVEEVVKHEPDIVGFSAFLTTTMPMFKANINALQKAGLRNRVIVMVGGAPVTKEYADAVGADGYAADALIGLVLMDKVLIEQHREEQPPSCNRMMGVCGRMEAAVKKPVLSCRMCGQCVLHSTGMVDELAERFARVPRARSPRRRLRGEAQSRRVWLRGYERSRRLPLPAAWRDEFRPTTCAGRSTTACRAPRRGRTGSPACYWETPVGLEAGEH